MNTLTERKEQYRNRVESQETYRDFIIDTVGVWGPLLAPAVPAALTMVSIAMHYPELLHIHWLAAIAIGLIVAVVIEVLGVVSVETFLDMKSFNQALTDDAEKAPAGWAGTIMGLYIAIVISLMPLTLLAGVTSWIVVMRKQHRQRVYRKELAELEEHRKNDLSATIDELRNEIDKLNSALHNEVECRNRAESNNEQLTNEMEDLRQQLAEMKENPVHSLPTVEQDPVESGKKSGESRRLSRNERQRMIAEWLLKNHAGSAFNDIPRKDIVSEFSVGRDTALNDLRAIWKSQNWNGSVPVAA